MAQVTANAAGASLLSFFTWMFSSPAATAILFKDGPLIVASPENLAAWATLAEELVAAYRWTKSKEGETWKHL